MNVLTRKLASHFNAFISSSDVTFSRLDDAAQLDQVPGHNSATGLACRMQPIEFSSDRVPRLASAGPHEIERGMEQLQVLLVFGCLGTVDLNPFPRTGHAARLKRDNVIP